MRNAEKWLPSKFVMRDGRLRATRDERQVAVSTRLIADIVAQKYDVALREFAKGNLLDLGCGQVPLYAAYRDLVDSVTCVDWANSLHPNQHVDLECDLSARLPFDAEEFDTIILSDVLEHLPEPSACWAEMARILRPAGTVILNVPFYFMVHEAPHDYYRYTQFALQRFAEQAGLEAVRLEPAGGAVECLADLIGQAFTWVRMKPLSAAVQSLAIRFWQSRRGQALASRTGERQPLGLFMVARKPAVVSP
jgi:SAM-dependent methyltransferase